MKKTVIEKKNATPPATRTEPVKIGGMKKKREMEKISKGGKNFWQPKIVGDSVEGVFIRMDKNIGGKFGEIEIIKGKKVKVQSYGVLVDETTGEEINLPSNHVLNEFFQGNEDKEIEPCNFNRFVRFTYEGKKVKKGKEGSKEQKDSYHTFLIEAEKEK